MLMSDGRGTPGRWEGTGQRAWAAQQHLAPGSSSALFLCLGVSTAAAAEGAVGSAGAPAWHSGTLAGIAGPASRGQCPKAQGVLLSATIWKWLWSTGRWLCCTCSFQTTAAEAPLRVPLRSGAVREPVGRGALIRLGESASWPLV